MELLPTFLVDRGEPYTRTITVSDSNGPIDFTGWSATAVIYDSNETASRTTGMIEPLIETNPSLDDSGNVVISFPDTLTEFPQTLLKPSYKYVCEIRLINPSGILGRLMRARVKVTG